MAAAALAVSFAEYISVYVFIPITDGGFIDRGDVLCEGLFKFGLGHRAGQEQQPGLWIVAAQSADELQVGRYELGGVLYAVILPEAYADYIGLIVFKIPCYGISGHVDLLVNLWHDDLLLAAAVHEADAGHG